MSPMSTTEMPLSAQHGSSHLASASITVSGWIMTPLPSLG